MRLQIWLQPLAWLSAWQSYLSGWSHAAVRLAFGKHLTRSQLEHTALLTTRNPPGISAKGDLAMFPWSATNTLPTIGVPTLVLAGDKDIITLPEASEMIAASIPAAHLRIIKDANHTDFAALAFERMGPPFGRPADTPPFLDTKTALETSDMAMLFRWQRARWLSSGLYEVLDQNRIEPQRIAGASIGAVAGAIIAGNTAEQRLPQLRAFWDVAAEEGGRLFGSLFGMSARALKQRSIIQTLVSAGRVCFTLP